MNESEIEKNLEAYDYKNYKGVEEDRRKLQYSTKKMNMFGVSKNSSSTAGNEENVPDNEEKDDHKDEN